MARTHLTLNGAAVEATSATSEMLLDVLREEFGLKASRFGCGEGSCGACVVWVDGQPITSCTTPLWAVGAKAVTTLEGLGSPDAPHPIQQAFLVEQAFQCGYCLSGIMMTAAALLAGNPDPSDSAIRAALDRHLCRCGSQARIIRAVKRAAASMRDARAR